MPREEKPIPQIPWAEYTKVTYLSDMSVELSLSSGQKVEIWNKDFEWTGSYNSKIDIDSYMKLDDRLTQDIQEHFDVEQEKAGDSLKPVTFQDMVLSWLKSGLVTRRLPRKGPKEWMPPGKIKRESPWKLVKDDGYGYGNTANEDAGHTYLGDVFEFAHFETDDGEEGAVVIWHGGGDPRGNYGQPMVYLGRFGEFMTSQYEYEPEGMDTFLQWNQTFENGLMWAWHQLGVFEDPDAHLLRLDDRHVRQVLRAIEHDPSILLPESVEQVLENGLEDYPREIQKAVTWLMTNKRRELEKALGQKLIWEDLYGK